MSRYFLISMILIFSSFSVSAPNDVHILEDALIEAEREEALASVYPTLLTQNVSKKLDSVFKRIHKRHDFHGSVLVAKKGKIIFTNQYGTADFKEKTKLNKNSTFQLASVSKQFTATAIMILYERKLLNLDDFVIKYFPDFPYKEITIRHLLNHTSGLPKYFWLAEHKWKKEEAPINSEMMKMIADHNLQRFFSPGRNFDYSNTGYFVLASIIEKVADMDYGDFLQANIFKPLQMENSFVYRYEKDSINENQLSGYRVYRNGHHARIGGTVNDAVVGDKNVYSTAKDLFKWINGLNTGKIISAQSLEMMYAKGETKYGRKVPYGFGFRIDDNSSEKIIYHHGKWNGFSTSIMQYTDSDLVVITLEHSSYHSMKHLNNKVKSIVEENFIEDSL